MSLVFEGVFSKFPELTVVMLESGVTWLPAFLWRLDKTWRGTRTETPWVKLAPSEYIRRSVRFTVQPLDEPAEAGRLLKTIEQLRSDDMLLFSTDYPRWRFEGHDALPPSLDSMAQKIMVENPLKTYRRLEEMLQ
jgi:predicted TIM-barrel fold metal-dependent hydrolase